MIKEKQVNEIILKNRSKMIELENKLYDNRLTFPFSEKVIIMRQYIKCYTSLCYALAESQQLKLF